MDRHDPPDAGVAKSLQHAEVFDGDRWSLLQLQQFAFYHPPLTEANSVARLLKATTQRPTALRLTSISYPRFSITVNVLAVDPWR